eukprot:4448783-Alexandrium_andersonii.AAC.1
MPSEGSRRPPHGPCADGQAQGDIAPQGEKDPPTLLPLAKIAVGWCLSTSVDQGEHWHCTTACHRFMR